MSAFNTLIANRNTLIAAVVAVVIVCAGAIAFYTYSGDDGTTMTPTQTQQQTPAK